MWLGSKEGRVCTGGWFGANAHGRNIGFPSADGGWGGPRAPRWISDHGPLVDASG